jgi:hypothetical protein
MRNALEKSVIGNYLKKVVGRDGIEPPTPGFSVLDHDAYECAYLFDVEDDAPAGIMR